MAGGNKHPEIKALNIARHIHDCTGLSEATVYRHVLLTVQYGKAPKQMDALAIEKMKECLLDTARAHQELADKL